MFDDLAAYYHENVVTAYVDYRDTSKDGIAGRSRDLRQALVAANALFHLREYLPNPGAPSRAEVERQCPDYALLGDVVNATKHKSISKKTPHGAPLVTQATSLAERQVFIEYQDEDGPYRHAQKIVVATLSDGTERNLLEVLTNDLNHWETHLHSLGIIASARHFAYQEHNRFRSRGECNEGRLDLEIVQGQRFRQLRQFLRFNKTTGIAEPIDLTGATIRAKIYKPHYDFDLTLKNETTGKEYTKTISLTEEESAVLHKLSSDDERNTYAANLPAAKAAIQDLALAACLVKSTGNK